MIGITQEDFFEQITSDILPKPIPEDLKNEFAPATHFIYEWTEYYFDLPGTDEILIGTDFEKPKNNTTFKIKFENQLGLTRIQPYSNKRPIGPSYNFEVISKKFPSLHAHHNIQ